MGQGQITLLLVEDEAIIGFAESRTLSRERYSVIHVLSGEEAVEIMSSDEGHRIDLILMDINLGAGIDGIDAAREILKYHNVPIVFLSAHTDENTIKKTELVTNYGYVVKNLGNTMLLATIKMALKLHQAKTQITEREERIKDLIDKVQEGICIMDENDTFLYANSKVEAIFSVERGQLVGKSLSFFVDKKVLDRAHEQFEVWERGGEEVCQMIMGADGVYRKVKAKVIPEFDSRGTFKGSLAILASEEDSNRIERKKGEGESTIPSDSGNLLIKELGHRIKNSLNIIISLLSLEAHRLSDETSKQILRTTEARIRSMTLLYDYLSQSSRFDRIESAEYMQGLIGLLKETYIKQDDNILIRDVIDQFELDSKACSSIGLIVNELLSNALKYAFHSGQSGIVTIELLHKGDCMMLRVRDNGAGFPHGFDWEQSQGFGLQLVKAMVSQLGGTVEIVSDCGVAVTVCAQLFKQRTAWGTRKRLSTAVTSTSKCSTG